MLIRSNLQVLSETEKLHHEEVKMPIEEDPAQGKTQQSEKESLLTIIFCGTNIYIFREIRIFQFITSSLDFLSYPNHYGEEFQGWFRGPQP